MFQSDDLNFDEDFLSDAFDISSTNTNNQSNKRNSDPLNEQPVKKICTQTTDNTKNILSIIKSKSSQTTSEMFPSFSFTKPNSPVLNISVNQEKHRRVVQRKFPGPAGILPEQKQNIKINTLEEFDTCANNKILESDEIVCSQLSEDIFKNESWQKMLTDWSALYNRISLPDKFTISWIKSKAVAKKLIGQKAPFLAAAIQIVDCSSKDPMILLKDKTGEIQATLLHEVWEEYCDYLKPGSVIVLKQVGVLSTLKKHYLAITLNNIVTIYSEQTNDETGKITIQELTIEEFIKTIENTKQIYQAQKVLQKLQPSNNPYFKTTNNVQDIPVNKSIIRNEIKNSPIGARSENKFKTRNISEPNKEKQLPVAKTNAVLLENKQKDSNSAEENILLTQVLDGVDTDLLFEDF